MNEITEGDVGQTLKVAGWVENIRDHGGVSFIDLRDMYGVLQVVMRDTSLLDGITKEDCVSIEGIIEHRDEETYNPKIPTGTIELEAKTVEILGKLEHQINEEIRDKELRVIGADGSQLGIMTSSDALALAEEKDLDLVKIAPNAVPPVCKIMDYGKFRFEQLKKEKEAKKNQKVVEIKEIRMSPSIDTNDFNTKVKSAVKFLNDGNRVKVTVRFRGREMAHTSLGQELLAKFGADCSEIATIAKDAKLEGRNMSMFLSPKNSK